MPVKSKLKRDQFEGNKWYMVGNMVPTYGPPPLNEVEYFQFPSLGFNVFNGDFSGTNIINNIIPGNQVRADDLIIDVRGINKYSVSCWGEIRGIAEQDKTMLIFKD